MLEQNYGPDGIALGAAAILLGLAGRRPRLCWNRLLLASGGHNGATLVGYALIFIAIAFAVLGAVRAIKGILAGRRFRGSRPFARRPDWREQLSNRQCSPIQRDQTPLAANAWYQNVRVAPPT